MEELKGILFGGAKKVAEHCHPLTAENDPVCQGIYPTDVDTGDPTYSFVVLGLFAATAIYGWVRGGQLKRRDEKRKAELLRESIRYEKNRDGFMDGLN